MLYKLTIHIRGGLQARFGYLWVETLIGGEAVFFTNGGHVNSWNTRITIFPI